MLDIVDYATLLQYSPRGTSETARKSQAVTGTIKAGRIETYRKRVSQIIIDNQEDLEPFLNPEVTLVPVPRSSPIKADALWPSFEICKLLASLNLGTISTCLIRKEAIRKSSLGYSSNDRPSIAEQYASMSVKNDVPSKYITLVDDVLTMGRTSLAGASLLSEKFSNAEVKVFALIRTNGFEADINSILDVKIGTIKYYASGKCYREP